MADVNQLITLGIGTPADIEHLVLTGLGVGETPPIPPEPPPVSGGISLNTPATIFIADSGADLPADGTIFALPAYSTKISWQTSFGDEPSSAEINLQFSLDGINFITVDTSTVVTGETRSLNISAAFVRVQAEDATDGGNIVVELTATREKL